MNIQKNILPFALVAIMLAWCQADFAAVPAQGYSIVYIGDSNTEIGFITGEMKKLLDATYGDFGWGYQSLSAGAGSYENVPAGCATTKLKG